MSSFVLDAMSSTAGDHQFWSVYIYTLVRPRRGSCVGEIDRSRERDDACDTSRSADKGTKPGPELHVVHREFHGKFIRAGRVMVSRGVQ